MEYNKNDRYDLGKRLYGVDNSKTMYDVPEEEDGKFAKLKQVLHTPTGIYMLLISVAMLVWFLRTLVVFASADDGLFLVWLFPSLFVLFVVELILIMSTFGLWGKFVRWAVRRGKVDPKDGGSIAIAQVEEASSNIGQENSFTVYENYIVVQNLGESLYLNRKLLKSLTLTYRRRGVYSVTLTKKGGVDVPVFAVIPAQDVFLFKDFFGDELEIIDKPKKKKYKAPSKYDDTYFDKVVASKDGFLDGTRIGGLVMGILCTAVGIGIVLMHVYLTNEIPWFLGAFFIIGGVIVVFTIFDVFPIVSIFFIPFLFGAMFTVFPCGLFLMVGDVEEMTFSALLDLVSLFTPVSAVIVLLTLIGLLLVIYSFIRLAKYIKYKKMK